MPRLTSAVKRDTSEQQRGPMRSYRVTLGRADHLDCSYRAGKKAMFTTCCSYPTKRTSRRHRPASPSRLLRAYPECTQSNFLGTSQVQRTRI